MEMSWDMHAQRKNFYKPSKVKNQANFHKCKEIDEYKCRVCGSYSNISAHHIVNRSLGGDDKLSNLITLCFHCHRDIHDGRFDFREYLNRTIKKHPRPTWFRWAPALAELNKRK